MNNAEMTTFNELINTEILPMLATEERLRFWEFVDSYPRKSEWMPIESAPRDGTKILYYEDGIDGDIATGYSRRDKFVDDAYRVIGFPTHWMPLPAPPLINKEEK